MRLPTLPRFISPAILFCLGAVLLFSSCAKKPQQAIIGKWNVQENQSVVEFRPDGSMVTTQNGQDTVGKYKFVDDSNFEMQASEAQATGKLTLRLTCELVIHGDNAEVTATLPGTPPVTKTLHYTRVK